MTTLQQLINNIQTPSLDNIKIDKSFFSDTDIKYNPSYSNPQNIKYIYSILSDSLTNLLMANDICLDQTKSILEIPKIAWPDFVISIKNIYDLSGKSRPLPELATYIYDIIIKEIQSQNISLIYIRDIQLKWIYINMYTSNDYKNAVLDQISQLGKNYGNIYIPDFSDKNIIVEFPSCNTAKAMWVHHVRAMVIGQVWNNIIAKTWTNICKRNYLGDRGTPFGKLIYSIQYHAKIYPLTKGVGEDGGINTTDIYIQIESHPNETLGNIYANFKSIESDNKEDIARSYFARLEAGDTDMVALWKYIRNLSLVDFQNIFDKFGVYPDCSLGESFTGLFDEEVVYDLTKANLLQESNGALIVKFIRQDWELVPLYIWDIEPESKDSMEIFIIKKSDGSTNYATRDLWLMKFRGQSQVDKIYICTDNGQSLHLKLINILAVRLWYIWEDTFVHIPFWLLLSGGEKMSTRWGKLFRLEDLISEIEDKVKTDLKWVTDTEAEKLAIAAIIYNDIKWDINKDLNFDIKTITNLSWDSGIYLKWTMGRLYWLKEKIWAFDQTEQDSNNLSETLKSEYINNINKHTSIVFENDKAISDIIVKLSYISQVYSDSIALVKPHIIVQYILSLCADINSWYNNWPKILELSLEEQKVYSYILHNVYICLENLFDTIQIKSE